MFWFLRYSYLLASIRIELTRNYPAAFLKSGVALKTQNETHPFLLLFNFECSFKKQTKKLIVILCDLLLLTCIFKFSLHIFFYCFFFQLAFTHIILFVVDFVIFVMSSLFPWMVISGNFLSAWLMLIPSKRIYI